MQKKKKQINKLTQIKKMKKKLKLTIILMMTLMIIQCKKTTTPPPTPICTDDKHFEGTYICTDTYPGLKNDTIKIIFSNMDSNCKRVMTIKGFGYLYNHIPSSCGIIAVQDYQIIDHYVTITNTNVYDNVGQLTATTNYQDISMDFCGGYSLNFKKIN